jgi:hypothetical protein
MIMGARGKEEGDNVRTCLSGLLLWLCAGLWLALEEGDGRVWRYV